MFTGTPSKEKASPFEMAVSTADHEGTQVEPPVAKVLAARVPSGNYEYSMLKISQPTVVVAGRLGGVSGCLRAWYRSVS